MTIQKFELILLFSKGALNRPKVTVQIYSGYKRFLFQINPVNCNFIFTKESWKIVAFNTIKQHSCVQHR